jgi:hypothetical protein
MDDQIWIDKLLIVSIENGLDENDRDGSAKLVVSTPF